MEMNGGQRILKQSFATMIMAEGVFDTGALESNVTHNNILIQ